MKKIKGFLKSLNYEFKQITWLTKKEVLKIFLGVCVGLVILLTVVVLGNLLGYFIFNKLFI